MAIKTKRKERTVENLNKDEKWFYNTLSKTHQYLADKITFNDRPYEGTRYKSDLVLPLPNHPYFKGVVIEIQGGVYQNYGTKGARTGHASPDGIARDNHKCMIAQLNNYFYLPVMTNKAAYQAAVAFLHEFYFIGVNLGTQTNGKEEYDLDF